MNVSKYCPCAITDNQIELFMFLAIMSIMIVFGVQNPLTHPVILLKHYGSIYIELVECINPEVRKGRLYRLTDKGEDVVKNLE